MFDKWVDRLIEMYVFVCVMDFPFVCLRLLYLTYFGGQ